ncbi:hypothetical protein M427DRAFT_407469 [Gonapodya prolifera JEL478]|uniref:Integrator complex subunit 7 helical bundle domain-containing protein n=1 Tax=Gonapodya prolifera (strain JEL478) TaxID=1344416 RepID=A0A139AUE1_GONPJ|nr:hypothetical protein M427DRAFT_407469 [Gonapodya prolifera JEL478]|eukprot:KXS20327.1 hypothetical protein M427DRAFT_407469 [Gonapodya prolifera JEL478]
MEIIWWSLPLHCSLLRYFASRPLSDPSRVATMHTIRSSKSLQRLSSWQMYTLACVAATVGAWSLSSELYGSLKGLVAFEHYARWVASLHKFSVAEKSVEDSVVGGLSEEKLWNAILELDNARQQLSVIHSATFEKSFQNMYLATRILLLKSLRTSSALLNMGMVEQLHSQALSLMKLATDNSTILTSEFGPIDRETEGHLIESSATCMLLSRAFFHAAGSSPLAALPTRLPSRLARFEECVMKSITTSKEDRVEICNLLKTAVAALLECSLCVPPRFFRTLPDSKSPLTITPCWPETTSRVVAPHEALALRVEGSLGTKRLGKREIKGGVDLEIAVYAEEYGGSVGTQKLERLLLHRTHVTDPNRFSTSLLLPPGSRLAALGAVLMIRVEATLVGTAGRGVVVGYGVVGKVEVKSLAGKT